LVGRLVLLPVLFVVICVGAFRYVQSHYLSKAAAAARVFHRELSQGQASQLYFDADERFRLAVSLDSAVEQIERLRKRLGDCQYSGPTAWSVSTTRDGLYVVTKYRGHCTHGEVSETLNWHLINDIARLAAFHESSRALLRGDTGTGDATPTVQDMWSPRLK